MVVAGLKDATVVAVAMGGRGLGGRLLMIRQSRALRALRAIRQLVIRDAGVELLAEQNRRDDCRDHF